MKLYTVAVINFFDNELKIHFKEAESWFDALSQIDPVMSDYFTDEQQKDQEEGKQAAFDADWVFAVEEVPS